MGEGIMFDLTNVFYGILLYIIVQKVLKTMNEEKEIFYDDWEKFEAELYIEDPELAEMCFKSELNEYQKTGDMTYVLRQLKTMAKAFGWTELERKTGLRRSTLYTILEGKKEPKLGSFTKILEAFGYRITFRRTNKPKTNKVIKKIA